MPAGKQYVLGWSVISTSRSPLGIFPWSEHRNFVQCSAGKQCALDWYVISTSLFVIL